jgi:hypothetical protein
MIYLPFIALFAFFIISVIISDGIIIALVTILVIGFYLIVIQWLEKYIIKFRLTENGIVSVLFFIPIVNIRYEAIRDIRVIKTKEDWRFLYGQSLFWLSSRFIARDGRVLIERNSRFWNKFIISPSNPEQFVEEVKRRMAIAKSN